MAWGRARRHAATRRRRTRVVAGPVVPLAFVLAAMVAAPAPADDDEAPAEAPTDAPLEAPRGDAEVEALREEIAASRERVVSHEREERDLLELLEEIDRGLSTLRDEVRTSERHAERAQSEWNDVEARQDEVRRRLATTRRAMSRRAVALYKTGEIGPIRVLFSSVDLQEMLWKMSTLGRLLRYDANLVDRYARERARLLVIEEEAARALAERDAARARLAARSAVFDQERQERRRLLARVRDDRSRERGLLVELERAARALEETLARLGEDEVSGVPLASIGFAERKGRLARPVAGRARTRFGRVVDEVYKTETFHNGIEIDAGLGESVIAVAPGQVRFAGWFRGYGKIVIVDHGGGYFTVSGHLSDIYVEVGDRVGAGDTLGSVGDTGSLEGPGLYFEVRSGSESLDPAQWLVKG